MAVAEPALRVTAAGWRNPAAARAYARCQLGGWGAYTLATLVISLSFRGFHWEIPLYSAWAGLTGLLLSHTLRTVARARRWKALPMRRLALRLALASLACGILANLATTGLGVLYRPDIAPPEYRTGILLTGTFNWSFTFLLWSTIYAGVHAFRSWQSSELARLRAALSGRDAQLDALRAQLQPHFLFNSLNNLRALIVEDPARAQDAVTRLSNLMRYGLGSGRRDLVPLADELAIVDDYLALEQLRLEERLAVERDVAPGAGAALVPPMLVQLLVENAIKHGIAPRPGGGTLRLAVRREADRLRIEVANPGRLATAREGAVGLANARERLALLHGDDASLTLTDDGGDRVLATAALPWREA